MDPVVIINVATTVPQVQVLWSSNQCFRNEARLSTIHLLARQAQTRVGTAGFGGGDRPLTSTDSRNSGIHG